MNKTEKEMLEILINLRKSGAVAVKAEFEAEGTRTEELLRMEGAHDISLQINKILKGLGFQPGGRLPRGR